MFNKKILAAAAAAAAISGQAWAGQTEAGAARMIGEALRNEFRPESVSVTVADGGRRAWAECLGADISGIKIKEVRLDAVIDPAGVESARSGEDIMSCIESSRGEITIAERDVNEYFERNGGASGFSSLRFDFTPNGYRAKGRFEAELLVVKLDLNLEAEGRLGLRSDGVYLEDTILYAEGAKQSDSITELVTSKVNPLLSFSDIPFPVEFSSIKMSGSEATMTGNPEKPGKGERWSWNR